MVTQTEQCPYCGQPITPKKLQEIEVRISFEKEEEYKKRLEAERENWLEKGKKLAEEEYKKELAQLSSVKGELGKYKEREEKLLELEARLKDKEQEIELDIKKRVSEERDKIVSKTRELEAKSMKKSWRS